MLALGPSRLGGLQGSHSLWVPVGPRDVRCAWGVFAGRRALHLQGGGRCIHSDHRVQGAGRKTLF
jgi:hypothetical protein